MSDYQPSAEILINYAQVLVHLGLGKGQGITPGDVVLIKHNQGSAAFIHHLYKAVLDAGGHPMLDTSYDFPAAADPTEVLKTYGGNEQLAFFPLKPATALWEVADHRLSLKSTVHIEPSPTAGTEAAKARQRITKQQTLLMRQFRDNNRDNGKAGWKSTTLAYYPTPAMAKEAGVTLRAFWQVIIDACCLESADPVAAIRQAMAKSQTMAEQLNQHDIASVHVVGDHVDLQVAFAPESQFVAATGGNIPSFETFTTPAASQTNGWIACDIPTLHKGERIAGVKLTFMDGVCTGTAQTGNDALQRLLQRNGANRIGEFALTDKRLSAIRQALPGSIMFMENIGGTGHIALGNGYPKCFNDPQNTPDRNESVIHHDLVFNGDCTITATLRDGSQQIIWKAGQFTLF